MPWQQKGSLRSDWNPFLIGYWTAKMKSAGKPQLQVNLYQLELEDRLSLQRNQ